jgi:hypothetical protein
MTSMARRLDPKILEKLQKATGTKESTIRSAIARMRGKHGNLPINAVAHLYALQHDTSVFTKLNAEEKASLPNVEIDKPIRLRQAGNAKKKETLIQFVRYQTDDPFIKAHILEMNRAYTAKCYTSLFILCRKMLENLLAEVIKRKFPQNVKENIELYFDLSRTRTKDFSDILSNLRKKAIDFGTDKPLLERMLNRCDLFKDDANNKAHSWYHIVRSRPEIDNCHFQDIIDMISRLEMNLAVSVNAGGAAPLQTVRR